AVDLPNSCGTGGSCYESNIATCNTTPIGPGTVLTDEPGDMKGPTKHGIDALIALDPEAHWDPAANNNLGAPTGGCMAAGTCSRSPRLVAVSAYDPAVYEQGKQSGRLEVTV